MALITVVYDACVLYPGALRDFLIQLATMNLFKAKWTNRIHDEWIFNLVKNRPDLTIDRLQKTRQLINSAVSECLVEGYERLTESINLPDKNDHHVLAAAIHSQANLIVTFNLKDFPIAVLKKYKMKTLHPDDFIMSFLNSDLMTVCKAAQQHRGRLKNPPKTAEEYLSTLSSQGLSKTAKYLRTNIELI